MDNDQSKIGALYKKAFEDYQEQPSPDLWEKIARNAALNQGPKPRRGFSPKTMITAAALTAIVAVVVVVLLSRDAKYPAAQLADPIENAENQEYKSEKAEVITSPAVTTEKQALAPRAETEKITASRPAGKIVAASKNLPSVNSRAMNPANLTTAAPVSTLAGTTESSIPLVPVPEPIASQAKPSINPPAESSVVAGISAKNSIEVTEDQKLCQGESITLQASGGTSYYWSTGDETSAIVVQPSVTSTYTVTVTDHSGIPTIEHITVTVVACRDLYIPNAFTPNDDGKNDKFLVYGTDIRDFNLVIWSRTGQIIFETNDIQQGWDGKIKGDKAEMGVYVYSISYTDSSGQQQKKTGQLTLLK